MQNSGPAEDLKTTVLQLRETVLQQKETIMNQKETIRELTAKLSRCESQSITDPGSRRKETGKNTMGDVSRTPADTLNQLGQTLQSLKQRLENLESSSRYSKNQRRVSEGERERYSLSTTNVTNTVLQNGLLACGQKENRPADKFQLTFLLRTNYMYAKVKKSLPEMYSFTVCMWIKSSASPGLGTPFSYAVPGQANELVLIEWGDNPMEILINDKVAKLPFVVKDGKWHHICITWTTRDGVWEAFQDGVLRGNGENLAPYHPIKPQGVLVLGQEQTDTTTRTSTVNVRSSPPPCKELEQHKHGQCEILTLPCKELEQHKHGQCEILNSTCKELEQHKHGQCEILNSTCKELEQHKHGQCEILNSTCKELEQHKHGQCEILTSTLQRTGTAQAWSM
ncbi:UNVERIFIED_CONTAM: hypothetical protein FKN15_054158 [Acipenser sinensis]